MLTVTARARKHLKELWIAHARTPEFSLRLALSAAGQFGVLLDREKPGDCVVEHVGTRILLVGPKLAPIVAGATLDLESTSQGRTLIMVKKPSGKHGQVEVQTEVA